MWLSEPRSGLLATLDFHPSVRVETTGGFRDTGRGSGAVAPTPDGRFDVILLFCADAAALQ